MKWSVTETVIEVEVGLEADFPEGGIPSFLRFLIAIAEHFFRLFPPDPGVGFAIALVFLVFFGFLCFFLVFLVGLFDLTFLFFATGGLKLSVPKSLEIVSTSWLGLFAV